MTSKAYQDSLKKATKRVFSDSINATLPDVGTMQEASSTPPKLRDVRITIEGLERTDKPGEFLMLGVPIIEHGRIDFEMLLEILTECGYDRRDCEDGVEKMLDFLHAQELGRVLAERVKRVVISGDTVRDDEVQS